MGGKCYVFLMSAYSCDVDQGFRVQGLVTWSEKSETQKTFILKDPKTWAMKAPRDQLFGFFLPLIVSVP